MRFSTEVVCCFDVAIIGYGDSGFEITSPVESISLEIRPNLTIGSQCICEGIRIKQAS